MTVCLLLVSLLLPQKTFAVNPAEKNKVDVRWTKKPSNRNGLYTVKNSSIAQGVSLTLNALYYYGDVDRNGMAFNGGFQPQNLSIGGAASFAYAMPMGRFCNWRFQLGIGSLRGDNSKAFPTNAKKFNSIFGEFTAGIEIYPFTKAGFYVYAGVGLMYSHIKYNYSLASGTTDSFLPVIPLELGYDFKLSKSWMLRVLVAAHQGIVDSPVMNMDGYPMNSGQNDSNISFGRGGGNKWADGYFQIGVCVTYRWHNCETCRVYR